MFIRVQEKFRSGLLAQSEEFKKQVHNLVDEFSTKGPFTSNIPTAEALENINNIRAQMEALKKQEQEIRKGLNIFKIDQPPSKEIANLEKVPSLFYLKAYHDFRFIYMDINFSVCKVYFTE